MIAYPMHIEIKMTRQEVEAVRDYFLPFMGMLCDTNVRLSEDQDYRVNMKEILVQCVFQRFKALTELMATKEYHAYYNPVYELTSDFAIVVVLLLKQTAIAESEKWLCNLKQRMIDTIEKQIWD